jgi:RNA-directed DNA polymerase
MEPLEGTMKGTPSPASISTKLQRIATLAREIPGPLNNLAHHIDIDWLKEAYQRTRKDGATGVDGESAVEYARNLEANLGNLLDRAKSGTYQAPPVRRVLIPKTGKPNETRPIGIPTFEDKILQRAVVMVLDAIYEQDFSSCSWGFRPSRSAHGAIDDLWKGAMKMQGGWVVELDFQRFFDMLDRTRLREILRQRVRDGVLLRLIGKWLKAGVLEEGRLTHPRTGTPQGGVISPILANIYLHEVLDTWFERRVKPKLGGSAHLVRYADDAVLLFAREDDARRVLDALPNRVGLYGLQLHPEKTRMVDFRPGRKTRGPRGPGARPHSFDFLGFTHFWLRSRNGNWVVRQKTAKDRLSRGVRAANEWCRRHRHLPVKQQHSMLARKLRGHFSYYGITGNSSSLVRFHLEVTRIWRKWLDRRSQRRTMTWARFTRLLERYPLPAPRPVHSKYCAAKP